MGSESPGWEEGTDRVTAGLCLGAAVVLMTLLAPGSSAAVHSVSPFWTQPCVFPKRPRAHLSISIS